MHALKKGSFSVDAAVKSCYSGISDVTVAQTACTAGSNFCFKTVFTASGQSGYIKGCDTTCVSGTVNVPSIADVLI